MLEHSKQYTYPVTSLNCSKWLLSIYKETECFFWIPWRYKCLGPSGFTSLNEIVNKTSFSNLRLPQKGLKRQSYTHDLRRHTADFPKDQNCNVKLDTIVGNMLKNLEYVGCSWNSETKHENLRENVLGVSPLGHQIVPFLSWNKPTKACFSI